MKIEITSRNFTISKELKDFVKSKIAKLLKYDKLILSSRIILLKESNRCLCFMESLVFFAISSVYLFYIMRELNTS